MCVSVAADHSCDIGHLTCLCILDHFHVYYLHWQIFWSPFTWIVYSFYCCVLSYLYSLDDCHTFWSCKYLFPVYSLMLYFFPMGFLRVKVWWGIAYDPCLLGSCFWCQVQQSQNVLRFQCFFPILYFGILCFQCLGLMSNLNSILTNLWKVHLYSLMDVTLLHCLLLRKIYFPNELLLHICKVSSEHTAVSLPHVLSLSHWLTCWYLCSYHTVFLRRLILQLLCWMGYTSFFILLCHCYYWLFYCLE